MRNSFNKRAVSSCGLSHQGKIRDHNEDAFFELNRKGLWVVADGAGGHEKGEVASSLIVNELSQFQEQDDLRANITWIVERLSAVNQKLIHMRKDLPRGALIASTVCVLFFHESHCVAIWSGDSRIYLFRNNHLFQLTQDHNRKEEFYHAGFSDNELVNYPAAHHLTKAIGVVDFQSVDVQLYGYAKGDTFLLCSDGLTGELNNHQIKIIIQKNSNAKLIAKKLITSVLERKARDNVTVVVIKL